MSDLSSRPSKRRKTANTASSKITLKDPSCDAHNASSANEAPAQAHDSRVLNSAATTDGNTKSRDDATTELLSQRKPLAVRRSHKPHQPTRTPAVPGSKSELEGGEDSDDEGDGSGENDRSLMKQRPHWRGWVEVEDDDIGVNNQDAFECIKREAIEAAKGESGKDGKRKSLRKRMGGGGGANTTGVADGAGEGKAEDKGKRKRKDQRRQADGRQHSGRKRQAKVKKSQRRDAEDNEKSARRKEDSQNKVKSTGRWRRPTQPEVKYQGTPRRQDTVLSTIAAASEADEERELLDDMSEDELANEPGSLEIPDSQQVEGATTTNGHRFDQMARIEINAPRPRPPSSPPSRMSEHPTISPTPDKEDAFESDIEQFRRLLAGDDWILDTIKDQLLHHLTTRIGMEDHCEYEKVHGLLSQTVLAGEGNSMVAVGPRGAGKTALVEAAISDLQREHEDDFHVVRLNGFIHTDDKIALKEIWRQLDRELNVDDEFTSGRGNYADILSSLLALLSHEDAAQDDEQAQHQAVAKSVVFILDEFHLFASHLRQTLLYNLFDLAQSSRTPLAIIGLTTRVDVVEMLEKRVKSRFGQRIVQLTPPRTFEAYKQVCQASLLYKQPSLTIADTLSGAAPSDHVLEIASAWNTHITHLFTQPPLLSHLKRLYSTSRTPTAFFTSVLLPLASLTPSSPLLTPNAFALFPSLQPPDNDLSTILPSLSTLALSLLIVAARLEIILDSANTSSTTTGVSFDVVYEEYVTLAARSRVSASTAGQLGMGGAGARVWGKKVARKEWEGLGEVGAVVKVGGGGGEGKWSVDLGGLEEIKTWIEAEGKGVEKALVKWCRI